MAFTLTEFKSNIAKGGGSARPSLYTIDINGRNSQQSFSKEENLLVKAAQIPGATIAALPVKQQFSSTV